MELEPYILGENCWVRWGAAIGKGPWQRRRAAAITENGTTMHAIPNHLVRSLVQIVTVNPTLDTTPSPL